MASQVESPVTLKQEVVHNDNYSGSQAATRLHYQHQHMRHVPGDTDKETGDELETPENYGIDSPKGLFSMAATALLMNRQQLPEGSPSSSNYCKFHP